MDIYLAGTGEAGDLEITLIGLAILFALSALISWGIPRYRNYMHQRRLDRMRMDDDADHASEDEQQPDASGSWHSAVTH
ncbi:hypothetical protein KQI65_04630 [bacterium]|nr:hypothetical protein [bacterium]